MPSQLSPPACNRYICTKSCRCSGSQALPLLLLEEPSRPFFGTGDSKEGGLFHTPLHEFFRRRLDCRKGAGGVGGCSAWVAWEAEAEAWASSSSRGRGSSDPEAGLALGVPSRPEPPSARRGATASMLRRPSPAPSSALYASAISSWCVDEGRVGVGGWGGRLGLELGSASGLG